MVICTLRLLNSDPRQEFPFVLIFSIKKAFATAYQTQGKHSGYTARGKDVIQERGGGWFGGDPNWVRVWPSGFFFCRCFCAKL